MPAPERRLLFGIRPESVPGHGIPNNIHHHCQGQEPKMGLLQPGQPLPKRHGARHQSVSRLLLTLMNC
jgi:hypothetical protein